MTHTRPGPSETRRLLVRIIIGCFGGVALGATLIVLAGSETGSPIAVVGALLVLVSIVTGMVTVLTGSVLSFRRPGFFFRPDAVEIYDGESAQDSDVGSVRPNVGLIVTIVVAAIIANFLIIAFVFSPLGQNPTALIVIGLLGALTAATILYALRKPGTVERLVDLLGLGRRR